MGNTKTIYSSLQCTHSELRVDVMTELLILWCFNFSFTQQVSNL